MQLSHGTSAFLFFLVWFVFFLVKVQRCLRSELLLVEIYPHGTRFRLCHLNIVLVLKKLHSDVLMLKVQKVSLRFGCVCVCVCVLVKVQLHANRQNPKRDTASRINLCLQCGCRELRTSTDGFAGLSHLQQQQQRNICTRRPSAPGLLRVCQGDCQNHRTQRQTTCALLHVQPSTAESSRESTDLRSWKRKPTRHGSV